MSANFHSNIYGFLYRADDISPVAVQLAEKTQSRTIFDLSDRDLSEIAPLLKAVHAREALITIDQFLAPAFEGFFEQASLETIWVEYFPSAGSGTVTDFLNAVATYRSRVKIVPVTGDWNVLSALRDAADPPDMVALKGAEAMGLVGPDSVNIMFSTVKGWWPDHDAGPDIIIWGGVGTPEAAAAFIACGAKGIVFESLHWLTDQVLADAGAKDRLAKLRLEHTRIVNTVCGTACRVFDKGNSRAVRSLTEHLAQGDDAQGAAGALIAYVRQHQVHALKSKFGPDDLVMLGPEASMAAWFADRFGSSTAVAVAGFLEEVDHKLQSAFLARDRFTGSPAARELGVEYPFIQGAMSWISEVPEFAQKVYQAGGLPTVALGLRSRDQLEDLLAGLSDTMGRNSWAVNIVALPENPYLKDQIDLLNTYRPPFVVVAAGEPGHAARLLEQGHRVIYITADPELLRLAFKSGVQFAVLEGEEAGGHVGSHTTLTLAQSIQEMKRREPDLFSNKYWFLAGGIFNRRTSFWAAMLGADGVQMGTVYLSTEEIVSTGALSDVYQQQVMESAPGGTTVTGRSISLGVRSLQTDKIEAIRSAELEFIQSGGDEAEFRRKLETLAAGSLYIAARGRKNPGGEPLSKVECLREGQFMSGAIAGAIRRKTTLTALHRELAKGVLPGWSERTSTPARGRTAGWAVRPERVAITGMALANSLGDNPAQIWDSVLACKSGITEVPPELWDHSQYYDPRPGKFEKSYCHVGAFKRMDISRRDIGAAPQDFRTMSSSTRLTLWLARQAIQESGLQKGALPREQVGVFISQNSGEVASTLHDLIIGFSADKIVGSLGDVMTMTPEMERQAIDRIKADRVAVDDTTLVGRLNSAAGGFICNQYGFRGPSFAVTAACASSLVALYSAIHLILNGDIDAAVIGGGEEILSPEHFVEFASVGSLACISGAKRAPNAYSRPFDSGRDGMVLGEGGGVIVIERELSARRRGAPIHALIAGVGASNSDRGMVESLAESQTIALRKAFARAGVSPDSIDLVECHATSTVQGDLEEVKALKTIFPRGNRVALSAFKSQIGHTLGASGINGLVRGVMALKAGVLPPTINYDNPDPELRLEEHGFFVPKQPEPWLEPDDRPRRMLASAFGFGGANYTVVLEEERAGRAAVLISPLSAGWEHGPDAFGIEGVYSTISDINGQSYRVGVVADDFNAAAAKVGKIADLSGAPSVKQARQLAKDGIFTSPSRSNPLKPAVVFTGQGSAYTGMGRGLYDTFPLIREWMDRLSSLADYDLLDLMFNGQADQLKQTLYQQPALFCLEYAIYRQLADLGLKPTAMAGHSLGEIVALTAAGSFSPEDGFRLVLERARLMNLAGERADEPGAMIAVNAPIDYLEKILHDEPNAGYTNYNSGKQVVLGGATKSVDRLTERLAADGHRAIRLKVSMAFHSPILKTVRNEMAEFLAGLEIKPPEVPVMSNATGQAFPDDPSAIRDIIVSHLESPVRWMQNVKTLSEDFGVGAFVEAGPGNNLCHLITDTLTEPTCINTCQAESEVETFRRAAAQMAALGSIDPKIRVTAPAVGAGSDPLTSAVQSTINSFILSDEGEAIKPALLDVLRRSVDPTITAERLADILTKGRTPVGTVAAPAAVSSPTGLPQRDEAGGSAVSSQTSVADDHVEKVIQIIMEATGYERDEIEPDMDIRTDLAIRSSRLPVIMDMAEKAFGVDIELEDFIGVKTVRDIADRLAEKTGAPPSPAVAAAPSPDVTPPKPTAAEGDHVEKVIQIIMEATGYERDEIEPDMDIRTDLAIRSSRLPVIMDMAEKAFGVDIELEDFIGVKTVRDIADRLAEKTGAPTSPAVAAATSPDVTPPKPAAAEDDHVEKVIQIIMEATGYERDEIEPDMDIRTDLAIRSSRLPVIMDMAEKAFGVDIELEDFIGVKTVRDIADRLAGSVPGQAASPEDAAGIPDKKTSPSESHDVGPIHRLIFQDVALPDINIKPLELDAGLSVVVLSLGQSKDLAVQMAEELQKRFGVKPVILDEATIDDMAAVDSLAGLVLAFDGSGVSAEAAGTLWKSAFSGIQRLIQGRTRRFCLLVGRNLKSDERIAAETILGMLLAGAHEYKSMLFRAVFVDNGADLSMVLDHGLNTNHGLTQISIHGNKVLTPKAASMPTPFQNGSAIRLAKGDVIVISGGAKGITCHLAQALSVFNPKLALLGRSPADSPEVEKTLAELSGLGVETSYFSCDVTDEAQTESALAGVSKQYGRIDGVIHGAGVIRDAFIQAMTVEEFDQVMAVKLDGARNLYQGCKAHGLRFMVALSSVSGVFGNVGQANYCAANRAMSFYMKNLNETGDITARTFMLPPIAGAGMADTPDLRELFKLRGMEDAFINVTELSELFCRELLLGNHQDAWVLLARNLPPADTVLRELGGEAVDERILSAGVFFQTQDLPMIDRVQRLDLAGGEMVAIRQFHPDKDLWLSDHRPFKTLRHPLVSGIMAVETFLEAAHAMFPHLIVAGIRNVQYKDILECPPTLPREARIECRRLQGHNGLIRCQTVLSSRDISPTGRVLDMWSVNYEGEVLLSGQTPLLENTDVFPVRQDELTSGGLTPEAVQDLYEKGTGLTGRYRVIHSITGSGRDVIAGELIYGRTQDVAGMDSAVYQYSPYILESFWHLLNFHVFLGQGKEPRTAIPTGIGELHFTRTFAPGEKAAIEARRVSEDKNGHVWDARAMDDQGRCVALARGLQMSWFDV
jgi:acyl transferase domain-containing protein/NAD(P)H-dependent flavin oxidoreductase YrpB (nitropropane dioxygenase family)/NAD(P)-dependent dehydrogenase (short-subunit alcohol dehydrogenase family)